MSLHREFELFLDREWPLWREPKNNGGVLYHQLRRAFMAGFKIGDEGPTPAAMGQSGGSVSIYKSMTAKPRKFRPPRG